MADEFQQHENKLIKLDAHLALKENKIFKDYHEARL